MASHGPVADPTPVHMEATPIEFSRLFTIYLLSIKVMQRWTGDPLAEQKVEGLWEGVGTGLYIIYRIYVRKFLKKKKEGKDKGHMLYILYKASNAFRCQRGLPSCSLWTPTMLPKQDQVS